ncbi:MAG: hypothetical protein K9H13_05585 [Bacteroidales bacterium]|nr:hypothetical protein [Bacteroidales bacterium]MCF8350588.1 hypothetical protein [Bacteroidales bacterium]MCF8401990.1 hypothetical protein [Bacteroidales bacterium]
MKTQGMVDQILSGWPIASILVIISGLALILAGVSLIINIQAQLAMILLGILLFIFVFALHLPSIIGGEGQVVQQSITSLLKDAGLGSAAWFIAGHLHCAKKSA